MPPPRRIAVKLELEWPYKHHSGIFLGAQMYAQEHDWQIIVDEYVADTIHPGNSELRYDGIIARTTKQLAIRAVKQKIPLVNVWGSSPALNMVPSVCADFSAIGRLRAEHLLSRGLSRFAALISKNDRSQALEVKEFIGALKEAGFTCSVEAIALDEADTLQEWRKNEKMIVGYMNSWKPPIGVFVVHESDGRILAQMCRNRGWRVPEDVAIITGQNEEMYCEGLRPTLTSIEFGYDRIGYEAAKLLHQLIDGKAPPRQQVIIRSHRLVVRESTDFMAVDDPLIAAALKYIAANCHRNIGQDDVARATVTTTRTLQRRFRSVLNQPIVAEIRRIRLERAKRELTQGNRSISEIALNAGFGTAAHMYEIFKRELGVSPSQYREERLMKLN